ncbi:MAG: aminopeptidase P family protein [Chloroflexi bacterium]|nr:aminopeptidase P family protein [Chloroflexota bacterium]
MKSFDFAQYHGQLDRREPYGNISGTPWYPGATYAKFSDVEFERRYRTTREKMARLGLDVLIAPGSPHHWSWGGGMLWLSGHWNWHAMVEHVVVPLKGEPALIYSQGGAHLEATRRAVYPKDVRNSRGGRFADLIAEVVTERGCAEGRIGIAEADWNFHDYIPVNQVERMGELLPKARIELVPDFFHELVYRKSAEEQAFVAKAGEMCVKALYAIRDRARPGVTEYELAASAAKAIMMEDGQVDFLIIGSTPMANPAQVFGNPRPSHRVLQEGDIIMNELAAAYHGYSAQIGIPICVGKPTENVSSFFDEIVLPGYKLMEQTLKPGNDLEEVKKAGEFFRAHGAQSRAIHLHGIDFVSNSPHVGTEHVRAYPYEQKMQPGAVLMLEPCPITADGLLGLFYGHTYIMTDTGARRVTECPDELLVAKW